MNILVIGDVMLDINFFSKVEKNAQEANIPVHLISNIYYILGGAANVAFNLKKLETNVELISVIGNDNCGEKIKFLLNEKKITHNLFYDKNRKTTQKNRIINDETIMVRFDIEDIYSISSSLEKKIIHYIKEKKNIEAIIISDYNKGVVTPDLTQQIINYANENNIYTFIDPKIKDFIKYKNCFCLKPNLLEGQKISGKTDKTEIISFFKKNIQCKNIILTCGQEGLYVNEETNHFSPSCGIRVVDVTGAGDVVLIILVYVYLKEKDIILASKIANFIAGESVQCIGNFHLSKELINSYLPFHLKTNVSFSNKIIMDYELEKINKISQFKKVVFTNGCFDILHSGHIKNLLFSKRQGDILVVGLNSDESIKRLKGEKRPINDIIERSTILSLFNFVDYIIIFGDDSPYHILKFLKPQILIKGSDYKKENIIGSEFVEEIIIFDNIENKSTSNIINKIIKNY